MERLTFEGNFCDIAMCQENPCPYNGSCTQREVWERLKVYEDTGLEPEYIPELLAGATAMRDILKYYEALEERGQMRILPFTVGDWVYALWAVPTKDKYVIYCAEVKEIWFSKRDCRLTTTFRLEPIEYRGRRKEYRDEDIGKLVFLSEEEAKAALEGVTNDDRNGN